ncbi:probable glutathione S-transferase 7 [Hydra vulgaris]|uniref:Probable glutathione S-transferase 7 n=1 Tax=Hydra vulgaris TaxID=6087 RepID=A0ABM4CLE3_HYDVU
MPTLEIDGHVVCQSAAINSYLAESFGFNGAVERLIINQVCETVKDFWNDYTDKKAEVLTKEATKLKLSFIVSLLKRYNDGHSCLVGDLVRYTRWIRDIIRTYIQKSSNTLPRSSQTIAIDSNVVKIAEVWFKAPWSSLSLLL